MKRIHFFHLTSAAFMVATLAVTLTGCPPEPEPFPDLVGMIEIDAMDLLDDLEITCGDLTEAYSDTVVAGYIAAQSVYAGTPLNDVSEVDLVVSRGPESANTTFERTGLKGSAEANSLHQCLDGGFIIGGDTNSFQSCVVRCKADGTVSWSSDYHMAASYSYGGSTVENADGSFTHILSSNDPTRAYVLELSSTGNITAQANYGATGSNHISRLEHTADGGKIIAGYNNNSNNGWLLKLDAEGDEEWLTSYGGDSYTVLSCVQQCADGSYIAAGSKDNDGWLVKANASGVEEWSVTFGGSESDWFSFVRECSDGGFIVTGSTNIDDTYYTDGWLIKIDHAGVLEWEKTFGSYDVADATYSVKQSSDGGFIVAGKINDPYTNDADCAWLIKTNAQGIIEWTSNYLAGQNDPEARDVIQTSDGGFAFTGRSNGNIVIIKTDASGQLGVLQ